MEGAFSKTEQIPETLTSILGNQVYEFLKLTLPPLLNVEQLNSNTFYQNPHNGFRITFKHSDGTKLTHAQWLTMQDVAMQYFIEIKNTYVHDSVAYESLAISFIESSKDEMQTIVIKPNLQ